MTSFKERVSASGATVVDFGVSAVIHKEKEHREKFSHDISAFLSRLPKMLSLPAAHELARLPRQEIQKYEHMYRFLYEDLKAILERNVSSFHLPSFDQLMEDARNGGRLGSSLREPLLQEVSHLLAQHLFSEVVNHVSLFAAFAANIENAKCIQEHGVGNL